MIPVRAKGQPVLGSDRTFTLTNGHALTSEICPACNLGFVPGDVIVLVLLGPGDNPESQAKAKAGEFYTGFSIAVHRDCAGV